MKQKAPFKLLAQNREKRYLANVRIKGLSVALLLLLVGKQDNCIFSQTVHSKKPYGMVWYKTTAVMIARTIYGEIEKNSNEERYRIKVTDSAGCWLLRFQSKHRNDLSSLTLEINKEDGKMQLYGIDYQKDLVSNTKTAEIIAEAMLLDRYNGKNKKSLNKMKPFFTEDHGSFWQVYTTRTEENSYGPAWISIQKRDGKKIDAFDIM